MGRHSLSRATRAWVSVPVPGSWPLAADCNAATLFVLVVTHHLDKVTVNLDNPQRPLLVAEAEATNRQMNDVLEQHGLVLLFNVVEAIHWRSAIEMMRVSCTEFAFKLTPGHTCYNEILSSSPTPGWLSSRHI